jgi:hypothetical protein
MGRITPVWQLTKALEFATKRQAYLASTTKPVKQTVDKRIKTIVGYYSSLVKSGASLALISVQAPQDSLTKFGGVSVLGLLANTGTALDTAIKSPRGFHPAQLHGLVGTSTPTVATAKGSGRRYIKYGASAAGSTQSTFSVPVSTGTVSPTAQQQHDKAKTVADSVATAFNADADGYGRLWFTPEKYIVSLV